MFGVTLTFICVLAVLAVGLHLVSRELWELENGFLYFTFGMVLLIVGVAVYMTYAVPTFAKPPLPGTTSEITVTQDGIELLPE
jgi:uncharacterized membrane protein